MYSIYTQLNVHIRFAYTTCTYNVCEPTLLLQVRKVFEDLDFMKTSELLLLGGPVGVYILGLTDIRNDYKKQFSSLLTLIGMCREKSSTPGALYTQSVCLTS